MSLENLKPEFIAKLLPKVELEETLKVEMPQEVLQQIQHLCRMIPKVEWSGVLFYTTEGSIKSPKDFKITLKTILPLDMGSSAYTEYTLDDRFLNFLEQDFEERCTWKVGHIHSHNIMGVFFSGTDMAELNDNAPSHNFYLSLIVNNFMDFTAKVAFVGGATQDIEKVPFYALDEEGTKYPVEHIDFEVKSQKLYIYNCDIQTPISHLELTEEFTSQVAKIMEPKPRRRVETPQLPPFDTKASGYNAAPGWRRPFASPPRQFSKQETEKKGNEEGKKVQHSFEDWGYSFDTELFDSVEEELDELEGIVCIDTYEFAKAIFRFSVEVPEEEEEDDLEDVLDFLEEFQLTPHQVAKTVIEAYASVFEAFYPEATASDFVKNTHELLDLLEDYKDKYPIIVPAIKVVTSMINKFIQNETRKQQTPA